MKISKTNEAAAHRARLTELQIQSLTQPGRELIPPKPVAAEENWQQFMPQPQASFGIQLGNLLPAI